MSQFAAALGSRVGGAVFVPGDEGYAAEVGGFNTAQRHTPDLVVAAQTPSDVVTAVRHAGDLGLRVGVLSTGHLESSIPGGLLISTRRLDQVTVDPETRTATVGGGVRWKAVVAAAAEHGLAPVPGASAEVGVTGYLLGGGLGPLARSHGFSSDYLERATVVTGAGDLVETGPTREADLFWALRGGKSGLGVVTEVRLRLVELANLYGGSLLFAEEHIDPVLRFWADWTAGADPRVTTSAAVVRFPPFEQVPEPLRGRRLLSLRFAFPGPVTEGARLAEPLRAAAPVYLDQLGELPAAEIARIHSDPTEPAPSWMRGVLLDRLDAGAVSAVLETAGPGTEPPFVAVELRHIGGPATATDVPGGSAVGGRGAGFTLGVVSVRPDLFAVEAPGTANVLFERLGAWRAPVDNVNFMGAPVSAEHYRRAWPPDILDRLDRVRRAYDPREVFLPPV